MLQRTKIQSQDPTLIRNKNGNRSKYQTAGEKDNKDIPQNTVVY